MAKTINCKYCGTSGFVWKRTVRGFRLFDGYGNIHLCKKSDGKTGGDTPPPDSSILTEAELQAKTVPELKKIAAEVGVGTGPWRQGAKKAELIDAITSGEAPQLPAPSNGNGSADLGAAMMAAIKGAASEFVNEAKVKAIIDEVLASRTAREVEVTVKKWDGTKKDIGAVHCAFDQLLPFVAQRKNVYLVGPAGSGKTTLGRQVAKALDLPFYSMSCGRDTLPTHFFGYKSANGTYVGTLFRDAYENGGVYLADEIDNASAAALTAVNQATDNGQAPFPDGMLPKHPDFVFLAAANTFGLGADRVYIGRTILDGATRDRFAFIEMGYDEALERELSPDPEWTKQVVAWRKAAERLKMQVVISPRASIYGGEMLKAGVDRETVESAYVWKGTDADTVRKIKAEVQS